MSERTEAYAEELRKLQKMKIAVGITENAASSKVYPTGINVVEVGAIHEYGEGNMPQRSFLRTPFIIKADSIRETMRTQSRKVLNGEIDAETFGNRAGLFLQNICQNAFPTGGYGQWAPNTEETIAIKGSSVPLTDSGLLKGSITYELRE